MNLRLLDFEYRNGTKNAEVQPVDLPSHAFSASLNFWHKIGAISISHSC